MKGKGKSMMYLLQLVRSRSPEPLFSSMFCKKNGDTLIEQLLQYFCGHICFVVTFSHLILSSEHLVQLLEVKFN